VPERAEDHCVHVDGFCFCEGQRGRVCAQMYELYLENTEGLQLSARPYLFGDDFDRADRRIVDGRSEVEFDFALGRGFNVLE